MITLESNTQEPEEMVAAIEKFGHKAVLAEERDPKAKAAEENPTGAATEEATPAETEPAKTAADSEPVETIKQEAPPKAAQPKEDKKEEKPEDGKRKEGGGWQRAVDKANRKAGELREQLEAERGDKVALQRRLDEVESKLAELKTTAPVVETKPAELVRPTRPKMPTMVQFQYDQEAFDKAVVQYQAETDKYDEDLDKYNQGVLDRKMAETTAAVDKRQKELDSEVEVKQARAEYDKRFNASREAYDDWDELRAELPAESEKAIALLPALEWYCIRKSAEPAHLMHFVLDDYVNNGGAEFKRIAAMPDQADQLIAIKDLENKLLSEHSVKAAASGTAEPKTKKAEAKEEPASEAAPAKTETPKPVQTVEKPITMVGGRAATVRADDYQKMAESGDMKGLMAKLNKDLAAKQSPR